MINDILNYLYFLEGKHGLAVSIHKGNGIPAASMDKLTPFNIHKNPFCLFIKEKKERHAECLEYQRELAATLSDDTCLTCICGVAQFVFPVKVADKLLCFVCVSGYKCDIGQIEQYAYKHKISKEELTRQTGALMPLCDADDTMIKTLVKPLCAMLSIYLSSESGEKESDEGDLYSHLLSVIHQNAHKSGVTIDSIAATCYCSKSMVSHLFKKRTGMSVNQYILKLRIERAEWLLLNTEMSVTDIAYATGYSDSNYFIYVFTKTHGISPLRYRKAFQKKQW